MCRLRNIALESVTDGRTDRQTDGRTTDKVIPMCPYALQATQKDILLYKAANRPRVINVVLMSCHINLY